METNSEKPTVLVVDDSSENIDLLGNMLRPFYKVKAALYGDRALKIAQTSPRPNMILLDIVMPIMDGYEVLEHLKSSALTKNIPVIFITALNDMPHEQKGLEMGAVDYITKPFNPAIVLSRVRTHMALYNLNQELSRQVHEKTEELIDTRLEIIRRLGRVAEIKDNETGMHIMRMSHYTRIMAEALNINDEWVELIFNAAPMHDVGKIGISENILRKNAKLNDEEWAMMKNHPQYGADIIGDHPSDLIKMSKSIALRHHEKWDGSGYPDGLKGEEIPLEARIVAIADVFDALTSVRPYKSAWKLESALQFINEQSGKHFDPKLIDILNDKVSEFTEIMERYKDKGSMNIIKTL